MNIYVSNLDKSAKKTDLLKLFKAHGKVVKISIARDKKSGASRGFAFVEMESRHQGEEAIAALNQTEFGTQKLHVNEARPPEEHKRVPDKGPSGVDHQQRGSTYHGRAGNFNRSSMGQRGGKRGG